MFRTYPGLRTIALGLAFALLLALVVIAEIGQAGQNRISRLIDRSQQRQLLVAELQQDLTAAEASERAFLLSADRTQLQPYFTARARIAPDLVRFQTLLQSDAAVLRGNGETEQLPRLRALINTELSNLSAALALYASEGPQRAMDLIRADLGESILASFSDVASGLLHSEQALVQDQLTRAARARLWSRALMGAVALLNLGLLLAAATLLARQARRPAEVIERLARENEQLERHVRRRTSELSALSSHLQHLSEREKATLARELHDEFGGLLVAVKMDVSWLQKRWPNPPQEIQARWARVLKVLDDGVDFKRRLVESLHPTLLDNIGLLPAVRWATQEYCIRAGLKYTEIYPEQEPPLSDDAAIMVFRLVQESLINIVRHAQATHVRLEIGVDALQMTVLVQDNGVGIDAERRDAVGSYGLAIMRHRVRSCGGSLDIDNVPQGGTRVFACLPLGGMLKNSAAPPGRSAAQNADAATVEGAVSRTASGGAAR